jgi:hypothetical protein
MHTIKWSSSETREVVSSRCPAWGSLARGGLRRLPLRLFLAWMPAGLSLSDAPWSASAKKCHRRPPPRPVTLASSSHARINSIYFGEDMLSEPPSQSRIHCTQRLPNRASFQLTRSQRALVIDRRALHPSTVSSTDNHGANTRV